MKENKATRGQFVTRLGVIATTVGSAVGLGNIWRFPYETGQNGGGAFLLFYIGFIILIGIPVICAEFILGRSTKQNIFGAFKTLSPKGHWHIIGYVGIICSLMILSFYSVVAGWTLEYLFQSITGSLNSIDNEKYHSQFQTFVTSDWRPALWSIIFLTLNFLILIRGVKKGIEKMSNIMMPMLFFILIFFCINSLLLPNSFEGIKFLFQPDFSKITPNVLLSALGQAFFSLSIGLGTMMTYASYFNNKTPLLKSASITATLDTTVAILAGIMIFPAIFSFGMSPEQGPTLVFEILPTIFNQLPLPMLWSSLFFFLLVIASLTSTISMSEVSIAFLTEEKGFSRTKATIFSTIIVMFFSIICALSFGCLNDFSFFGLFRINLFEFFDYFTSNILMPIGGLVISLYAGWFLDKKILKEELSSHDTQKIVLIKPLIFCLKYIAPIGIILIFLFGLKIIQF